MSTRLDARHGDEQMRVEVELGSTEPLGQLRGLRAVDRQVDIWQREAIARARHQGASWSEIGEALSVSKQAAWQLYNDDIREMLADVRERSGLSDEEAQLLADAERSPHPRR